MCIAVIARICDEAEISLPDPYSVTNDVHPFVYIRYKVSLPYYTPDQSPDTLHQTNLLKLSTSNPPNLEAQILRILIVPLDQLECFDIIIAF